MSQKDEPFCIDECTEYLRWNRNPINSDKGGRPATSASTQLRTRATLRAALSATGLTAGELAREVQARGLGNGYALVAAWRRGGALSKRSAQCLTGLHPNVQSCFFHPLWRLLDPPPLTTAALLNLFSERLIYRSGSRPTFTCGTGSGSWAFAAVRRALKADPTAAGKSHIDRVHLRHIYEAGLKSFAGPDCDALLLRSDLEAFTAGLGLLREAMSKGWDDVLARRAVLLVRMLPHLVRAPMLLADASEVVLLTRIIVSRPRAMLPAIEVNIPRVMHEALGTPSQPTASAAVFTSCPTVAKLPIVHSEDAPLPLALMYSGPRVESYRRYVMSHQWESGIPH